MSDRRLRLRLPAGVLRPNRPPTLQLERSAQIVEHRAIPRAVGRLLGPDDVLERGDEHPALGPWADAELVPRSSGIRATPEGSSAWEPSPRVWRPREATVTLRSASERTRLCR